MLDRYRKVRDIITKSIDLGLKSPILCPSFERKPRFTKEKRFEKDLYLFSFSYPWLIRILHAAIAVLHSSSQKASRSFITPRISALLSVVRTAVLLRKHHGMGGPREMHDAVCAKCGQDCQVPFKPRSEEEGGKPVLCRDCFAAERG